MAKRPVLGRGLASLIPVGAEEDGSDAAGGKLRQPAQEQILRIPIDGIDAGKLQPRKDFDIDSLHDLRRSIEEKGILQPLIARRVEAGYELIAGERRLRAAKLAGLTEVPLIIREASDRESLELALIENVQRDDLNAIELARAFRQLQEDFGYTQEEISERLGRDRSTVANHLRLLKLPDGARQALVSGAISMGHARALLGLDDPASIDEVLQIVVEQGLSVRDTEKFINRLRKPRKRRKEAPEPSAEKGEVTERLKRVFQTQVQVVSRKDGRGEIRIEYYSLDELNRILELMPET